MQKKTVRERKGTPNPRALAPVKFLTTAHFYRTLCMKWSLGSPHFGRSYQIDLEKTRQVDLFSKLPSGRSTIMALELLA